MKRCRLLFFILIFLSCGKEENEALVEYYFFENDSQADFNPQNYNYGKTAGRIPFFTEDFENNSHNWNLNNGSNSRSDILDGLYIIQSKSASSFLYSIPVGLNFERNFELEAGVMIFESPNNHRNGLSWGASTTPFNFNCLTFNANNNVWIGAFDGTTQTYSPWLDWSPVTSIKPVRNYNKLTVRKIGNKYFFFINEAFVSEFTANGYRGEKAGFIVGSFSVLYIDFLRIDYILI